MDISKSFLNFAATKQIKTITTMKAKLTGYIVIDVDREMGQTFAHTKVYPNENEAIMAVEKDLESSLNLVYNKKLSKADKKKLCYDLTEQGFYRHDECHAYQIEMVDVTLDVAENSINLA